METFKVISLPDISKTNLPMAYPFRKNRLPSYGTVLAADVGGTKTDLALFQIQKGHLVSIKNQRYPTTDHDSFVRAIGDFQGDVLPIINCACLGVAGTVEGDKVRGVNFAWEINAKKLERDLNIKNIYLINDLEANAYGLSALEDTNFETLTKGNKSTGNAAIISPGTGLGEAGLYWDGSYYHPYATEGGHCNFSPDTELDLQLYHFLKVKMGHVSWERVVSGQGIHNIYQFLRNYRGEKEPEWLTKEFQNQDPPIVISAAALEKKDEICGETLQHFVRYLSMESAQLALKTKATGGIYIGGGIVPKILDLINKDQFYENFISFGRMEHLLKNIPVKIVLNSQTALIGAAYYAAMGINETA